MYENRAKQVFQIWMDLAESHNLWYVIERYYAHRWICREGVFRASPECIEHSEKMIKIYLQNHEDILEMAIKSDPYVKIFAIMAFHVTILTHHSLYMSDAF